MQDFSEAGFSRFTDEWAAHDFLRDRQVSVQIGDRVRLGIARGTAPDGRLRLESQGVVESFVSGEVTLRE
jgi:BirA family biotin operon repressor/biotin-[acetyl-CoA-carboxylase] ligase